jgi:hypothetical protein
MDLHKRATNSHRIDPDPSPCAGLLPHCGDDHHVSIKIDARQWRRRRLAAKCACPQLAERGGVSDDRPEAIREA